MHNKIGCRVETELTFRGWRMVVLENQNLRVSILPEKGSDIIEFRYKPLDLDIMWESPLGLRSKEWFLATNGGGAQGNFMDYYEGGWQEILPNAGPASEYKGASIGQHGEVSLSPWNCQVLEDNPQRVSVKMSVETRRTPFRLEKVLSLEKDTPALFLEEAVTNLSEEKMEFLWGHHPAFGAPFLSHSCRLEIPGNPNVEVLAGDGASRTNLLSGRGKWPTVSGKKGPVDLREVPSFKDKVSNMFFLTNLPEGRYQIKNPEKKLSFMMEWDAKVFSHLWYWQVAGGSFHYPWWGRTYNIALEPFSGPPTIARAIKEGDALSLKAGKTLKTFLAASFITL
ncbi:MAG: aldose 1-epimerase [Candidatus Omnitrophota bacterium]